MQLQMGQKGLAGRRVSTAEEVQDGGVAAVRDAADGDRESASFV